MGFSNLGLYIYNCSKSGTRLFNDLIKRKPMEQYRMKSHILNMFSRHPLPVVRAEIIP
jgi:hypothetical protein